jgi:hypothetical protein
MSDVGIPKLMHCEIRNSGWSSCTQSDASHGWLNRCSEPIADLKQEQHERAIDLACGFVMSCQAQQAAQHTA